jgi:uncharacterized protein YndB with AHSA1/START domain
MSGDVITVRTLLHASRDEVFDAWLDADSLCRWMLPGTMKHCEAILDPQVGGRFHILMRSERIEYVHSGEYRVIDRPSKLVFTWVSSYMSRQETLVTVDLFDHDGLCELVLTQERVPRDLAPKGVAAGWRRMLDKLDASLQSAHRSTART